MVMILPVSQILVILVLLSAGVSANGKWAAVAKWRGTHPRASDSRAVGTVIGLCTAELIAKEWILTAEHCATRLLKHEKDTVRVTFGESSAKVERGVTHCVKPSGADVDVVICKLALGVGSVSPLVLNADKYTTARHGKAVMCVGTADGYHANGPKALEYEGNGAHLYVSQSSGSGMKAGDSGGAWIHEVSVTNATSNATTTHQLLSGVIHGGSGSGKHKRGIAAQVSFIRSFIDEHTNGTATWASASNFSTPIRRT